MVRGTDIKILAQKRFPLAVSLLFHAAAIALVFSITGHEREMVFTLELREASWKESPMTGNRDSAHRRIMVNNKKPETFAAGGLRQNTDAAPPASYERKPAQKPDDEKVLENQELTGSPPVDKQATVIAAVKHSSGGQTAARVSTVGGIKESEDAGRISPSVRAANEITEGEFGSINGPSFLKMVKPEYPRLARRLGKEGKVILRLFIDENGKLLNAEPVEKAGHGFDEAAIEAVKSSSFQPARLHGKTVACRATLPVSFKLQKEE